MMQLRCFTPLATFPLSRHSLAYPCKPATNQQFSTNSSLENAPLAFLLDLRPLHPLPQGEQPMPLPTTEALCPLADLLAALPQRNGRQTNRSTVLRWVKVGVRGVRLEAVRIGNNWLSSRESLQRFLDQLSS
jgi:Protein of unknown function (DUF1580)